MSAVRLGMVVGIVAALAACSSSTKPGSSAAPGTTAPAATTPAAPTTAPAPTTSASGTPSTAASSGAALPAPCSLLTGQDVASLFDNAAVTTKPTTGPAPGTAECTFNLSAGNQGRQVTIRTLADYANNPAYVFPAAPSTIPGLGDRAVIETTNTNERRITVKLGANALEVTVDFYDKPVDDTFVTHLATIAVGRA